MAEVASLAVGRRDGGAVALVGLFQLSLPLLVLLGQLIEVLGIAAVPEPRARVGGAPALALLLPRHLRGHEPQADDEGTKEWMDGWMDYFSKNCAKMDNDRSFHGFRDLGQSKG